MDLSFDPPGRFRDAADLLHETVMRSSGLDDFGPADYLPGLTTLLQSMDSDPQWSQTGRRAGWGMLVEVLRGRAHAIRSMRDNPAFAAAPVLSPVVIVGMPRTGTTLVDRILSSHPDVGSAGELQAMPLAVKELAATSSRVVVDAATIHASLSADPQLLGERYMARATPHRPAGRVRFIDKLPANILYVGHIARALPNARIVCLRRNPMDTVWSNFKNLFAPGSAYYFYSNDLMDTARYYARFDRLMAFWQHRFPGRILELGYEALVADQEGETRRLLAHCNLEWDAATLAFHQNQAAVATPSAAQVRRPISADAIGRWRVHADAMAPVRRFFEEQGIAVD